MSDAPVDGQPSAHAGSETEGPHRLSLTELVQLEGERIDPSEARRSLYYFGDIFFDGHGWVVIGEAVAILVGVGLGLLWRSPLPMVLGIAVGALLAWYADEALEDWVARHNAEADRRIRAGGGNPESGRRTSWLDD